MMGSRHFVKWKELPAFRGDFRAQRVYRAFLLLANRAVSAGPRRTVGSPAAQKEGRSVFPLSPKNPNE